MLQIDVRRAHVYLLARILDRVKRHEKEEEHNGFVITFLRLE